MLYQEVMSYWLCSPEKEGRKDAGPDCTQIMQGMPP